jgi:hypothetical protein
MHGTDKKCIKNVIRKPKQQKPLMKPWHRCEDNTVDRNLKETGYQNVDWAYLVQDRVQCCEIFGLHKRKEIS